MSKLKLLSYLAVFFMAFPSTSVLLASLNPDSAEACSTKLNPMLDWVQLGRSKPWVSFQGLPYPATLHMFGNMCGVVGVVLF